MKITRTRTLFRRITYVALTAASFFFVNSNVAQAACARPAATSATNVVIPTGRINQNLFSKAVTSHVNYHRCRAGLRPLKTHSGLTKVAAKHAGYMAKKSALSHNSRVAGQNTVKARLKKAVSKLKAGSENIGYVHRYRIDEGKMFYTKAAAGGNCNFATKGGARIPAHTYASMAKRIADLWANSSKHRKNMMDRKVHRVGTALAFDSRGANCGQYYLTQDYAN